MHKLPYMSMFYFDATKSRSRYGDDGDEKGQMAARIGSGIFTASRAKSLLLERSVTFLSVQQPRDSTSTTEQHMPLPSDDRIIQLAADLLTQFDDAPLGYGKWSVIRMRFTADCRDDLFAQCFLL
jgi:hypothetical protein